MQEKDIKKFWFHDSVFLSSFFDASSAGIPDLERFVVSSVENTIEGIRNENLKIKVSNLLHEELAHSRVHDAYNQMLSKEGYKINFSSKFIKGATHFFKKHFSDTTNIAISMSIEFFTLIFSKHILEKSLFADSDIDKRLKRLWTWHALEEIEHKSVCCDIFSHLNGKYVSRIFAMLIAVSIFFPILHLTHLLMLKQNKGLYKPKILWEGYKFLFGFDGMYKNFFTEWIKFFKPSFHPSQIKIDSKIDKNLHHYHIENDLINYF